MNKHTAYRVLEAESVHQLEIDVNEAIGKGWQCVGGVVAKNSGWLLQTIVKPASIHVHLGHLSEPNVVVDGDTVRLVEDDAEEPGMFRARFRTKEADYRPAEWPIKHPYWCTGQGEDYFIICAYVDSEAQLLKLWPEAYDIDLGSEVQDYVFTDRFPKPDWME